MNSETIESLIEQLKAAGLDDEKIMGVFYDTFKAGKMDREDLETLANYLGYELTDDFKNDPTPDPIADKGAEGGDGGITKDEAEDAKALAPGETAGEFKDKIDEMKGDEDIKEESTAEDGEETSDDDDKAEDDDEDWKKAQKMFNI